MGPTEVAIASVILAVCLLIVTIITSWDWAVLWTALSAIATFAAAGIALWLPFHQERRRRVEEESAKRNIYWDIFFEIERALKIYVEAEHLSIRTAQSALEEGYHREVRDVEERALNGRKVLKHLLRRDGIADGVIRRSLDAIDLNKETARSVRHLYDHETHSQAADDLRFYSVRRDRVALNIDEHKAKLGLPKDLNEGTAGASTAVDESAPRSVENGDNSSG